MPLPAPSRSTIATSPSGAGSSDRERDRPYPVTPTPAFDSNMSVKGFEEEGGPSGVSRSVVVDENQVSLS